MAETLSNFAALLKEYYGGQRVRNLVYDKEPLLAMVPKFTSFYGDLYPIPVVHGTTRGRSANFADAYAHKGQSTSDVFQLTRVSDYALASIGREVMKASENDKGAFLRAAKVNIDGALRSVTRSMSWSLFRKSTGTCGQVGSTSTVTLTLKSIHDIVNFEVGDYIAASDDEASLLDSGNTNLVSGIDRDAGTLTSATAWTTAISGLDADDYLSIDGDFGLKCSGLEDWVTTAAVVPADNDNHFGVERDVDPVRLGGNRLNGAGVPIEENLINIQSKVCREGGAPDKIFLNHIQYRNLIKSLGSKVEYERMGSSDGNAKVFFRGVTIEGDRGPIQVVADRSCQADRAYCLEMDTWKLYSLGECPDIFDKGTDQKLLRDTGLDQYEVRVGGYFNLGCAAPGYNGVCHTMDVPSA